jgi:hypothetical protein
LEEGVATDNTTPILIGSIYDQGQAGGGFHGLIDELRIWSVDRSQMEIQSTMHVSLTGAEFGLEAYWTFDECAGHSVRDKLGRHDGIAHGGLWHESPVELYDASKLAQAQASSQQQLDDLVVKGEKVNFDYWKRSVSILEDQIRVRRRLTRKAFAPTSLASSPGGIRAVYGRARMRIHAASPPGLGNASERACDRQLAHATESMSVRSR